MARKLTKGEHDKLVKDVASTYICRHGLKQARDIVYDIYKELRRQNNERKGKRK